MTIYYANGSPPPFDPGRLAGRLTSSLDKLGPREQSAYRLTSPGSIVRAVNSWCTTIWRPAGRRDAGVGRHVPMPDWQLEPDVPSVPKSIREPGTDVATIGEVPAEFVSKAPKACRKPSRPN